MSEAIVYDVRYEWVSAGETCRGYYKASSEVELRKRMKADGNRVISIKPTKLKTQIAL